MFEGPLTVKHMIQNVGVTIPAGMAARTGDPTSGDQSDSRNPRPEEQAVTARARRGQGRRVQAEKAEAEDQQVMQLTFCNDQTATSK